MVMPKVWHRWVVKTTRAHLANLQTRLDGATDPAEYNAILSEGRSEYMRKYNRLNPALLNKHMFPAMRQAEARVGAGWTAQRTKRIQEERLESSNQNLSIGLRGGNIEASVQNYMTDVGGTLGSKAAREGLVRQTELLIKGGAISQGAAERLLNTQVQAADGSGLVSIRDIVPALSNYKQWFIDRDTKQYNNDRNADKIETQQYVDQFNEAAKKRSDDPEKKRFTNDEIEKLKEDFKRDTGREPPSVYDDYTTAQEHDNAQEQAEIEDILGPNGRGYLIESDLEGKSFATRNKYNNRLKQDQAASIASTEFKGEAGKMADALAAVAFEGKIGKDDPKTPEYQNYVRRAKDAYDRYYRSEVHKGETPGQAHLNALDQMERNGEKGTYTKADQVGPTVAVQRQVKSADDWLNQGGAWKGEVIPGTDKALKSLKDQIGNKGPLQIPQAYKAIASTRKDMTAWDLANAQLKAYQKANGDANPKGLTPNGKNYAEAISPEINRLLTFKPTINRTRRAIADSGDQRAFLNLIASEESAGHGDYDAYNLGGSNNGNTPHGSGDSNDLTFGKPLTQMTVGEVIALQNTGQIHATGRYQFVKGTLSETVERAGIGMDEIYGPEIQDALAMSRANWRKEGNGGITGLRNEWVGLNDVPDHVLKKHYDALGRPTYDQPQNTTPGVQLTRALPSFSSQVSSVTMDTNQPGMDVFFEDKQFPAVLPGKVKEVSSQYNADGSGYGNFIVVESIDPTTGQSVDVLYSHLESPAKYKAGQSINTGQIIGKQGGTGSVQSDDGNYCFH